MCQFGTHFKKNVNWVPTFEKMPPLGPFQEKTINAINDNDI